LEVGLGDRGDFGIFHRVQAVALPTAAFQEPHPLLFPFGEDLPT